jgi:hypothetical protein
MARWPSDPLRHPNPDTGLRYPGEAGLRWPGDASLSYPPSAGVVVSGTFIEGSTVNLLASETFVGAGTSVEFFEQTAGSLGTDASGPPWTEEETLVTPGTHEYYIQVDGGPPSGTTQVRVTPIAPDLTEPDGGEIINLGSVFEFTATTFDDDATTALNFHVTGPNDYEENFVGVFDTDHWEYTWDTTGLDTGDYVVSARRSTAGGTVESEGTVTVTAFTPSIMTGMLDWGVTDDGVAVGGANTTWTWKLAGMVFTAANANAPTVNATDATLNNLQTLSFVRANSDRLIATGGVDRPAPNSVPTQIILLLKQDTWNSTAGLFSAGTQNLAIFQSGSTPNLAQNNNATVNADGGAVLGTWVLIQALFTGSTSDSMTIKGDLTPTTGASAGINNPSSTWTMGGNAALSAFSGFTIYFGAVLSQAASAGDLANLKTWLATRIGTSAPWTP